MRSITFVLDRGFFIQKILICTKNEARDDSRPFFLSFGVLLEEKKKIKMYCQEGEKIFFRIVCTRCEYNKIF